MAIPLPIDDRENEVTEGYIYILEVDMQYVHPSDQNRTRFLNRYILATIKDNDSKLTITIAGMNVIHHLLQVLWSVPATFLMKL